MLGCVWKRGKYTQFAAFEWGKHDDKPWDFKVDLMHPGEHWYVQSDHPVSGLVFMKHIFIVIIIIIDFY